MSCPFFENTRKPAGLGGKMMVFLMNLGHRGLSRWGFQFLDLSADAAALDCGCGGGANLKRLLKSCPEGRVTGVDYSEISVGKSRVLNQEAVAAGRCRVLQASVMHLPFSLETFNAVTALETVYFWPDLHRSFQEVLPGAEARRNVSDLQRMRRRRVPGRKMDGSRSSGMVIYRDLQLKSALEKAGLPRNSAAQKQKGLALRHGPEMRKEQSPMSIFASLLRGVYRLTGTKKAFTLPESEILKVIEKQNRHRGVFAPTDRKAHYQTIDVGGFPCLIVRENPAACPSGPILYFFGGGMVIGPGQGAILPVMRKLCRETGCDVWFPFYPLCTDHCITETYDMAYACYRQMIDLYGGGNVSTCGFSSGGALALGVAAHNNAQPASPAPAAAHRGRFSRRGALERRGKGADAGPESKGTWPSITPSW